MTFEKGDKIFNATCHENEVALDKRDKGGCLWAVSSYSYGRDSREKLKGQWFLKCPANATLYQFFQRTEVSSEPLRETEQELRKRMRILFGFARLVAAVAAEGRASVDMVTHAWSGLEYSYEKRQELEEILGEPGRDGPETYTTKSYEASVAGFPFNVMVVVSGPKSKMTLTAPPDFNATDCCNFPHSCCKGHR